MADIVIIGNGPAGISAALYTQRAGLETVIIGKDAGALEKADKIENYFGFEQPIKGTELVAQGISQARRIGAEVITDEVVGIAYDEGFEVKTKNTLVKGTAVILATGAKRSAPPIKGIKELEGKGVSYCAVCDGFFYRGKNVAVLGAGDYALHEAGELMNFVASVTILTNGKEMEITLPQGVELITKKIKELSGEGVLKEVIFEDGSSLEVSGLFVAEGVAGSADFARHIGAAVTGTRIDVDENMKTTVEGLFAAGDCTGGLLQISKAVSDGAKAGTAAIKFVREKKSTK